MKMRIIAIICIQIIISACSTHIVERVKIVGKESEGWSKKNNGTDLKYTCGSVEVIFKTKKITQRNVTNSIFWIAIIPNFSEPDGGKDDFTIQIQYAGKTDECGTQDVMLILNNEKLYPDRCGPNGLIEGLCHYYWDIENEQIQKGILKFKKINNCSVPDLAIDRDAEYSYENHFTPW